jgi:hypothetical protein
VKVRQQNQGLTPSSERRETSSLRNDWLALKSSGWPQNRAVSLKIERLASKWGDRPQNRAAGSGIEQLEEIL